MKFPPNYLVIVLLIFISFTACKNDNGDDQVEDFKAENRKGLGRSAADLLSNDTYQGLTVEFVYANGFRPRESTINTFLDFLSARVVKPDGINLIETVISAPQGAPFTTEEIRDIEDEFRTKYTVGDEIAVFVFFANGNSDNDTETSVTLGTAYQNTSIVIYEKTLEELSASQNIDLGILEINTLNHEFGHLFGLVNILEDDIHTDHEDPNNSKHCVVQDCLMFFETSNTDRAALQLLMNRSAAPEFDPLCIADLQAKGGL